MSDTPTPRTEMMVGLRNPVGVPGNTALIETEFARQLERELAAANERIRRLEEAGDRMNAMLERDGWDSVGQMMWAKAKEAKP